MLLTDLFNKKIKTPFLWSMFLPEIIISLTTRITGYWSIDWGAGERSNMSRKGLGEMKAQMVGENVHPLSPKEEEWCPYDAVSIDFEAHHGHEGIHGKYHEGPRPSASRRPSTLWEKKNKNIVRDIIDPATIRRIFPVSTSPNSSTTQR